MAGGGGGLFAVVLPVWSRSVWKWGGGSGRWPAIHWRNERPTGAARAGRVKTFPGIQPEPSGFNALHGKGCLWSCGLQRPLVSVDRLSSLE